jgi:hypothetical protein
MMSKSNERDTIVEEPDLDAIPLDELKAVSGGNRLRQGYERYRHLLGKFFPPRRPPGVIVN